MTDWLSTISPFAYAIDDYSAGADITSPLTDVSNGAQDMQTYTATGNGSGVFIDSGWQNAIMGGLQTALNYAIKRDSYQQGIPQAGAATAQQVVVQQKQTNVIFIGLCVLGAVLVLKS